MNKTFQSQGESVVFPGPKIETIALVGAVKDVNGELGPRDEQWKNCGIDLCRRLGITLCETPSIEVVNQIYGDDYLSEKVGVQAELSIICFVKHPESESCLRSHDNPYYHASRYSLQPFAWVAAANRVNSKYVITYTAPYASPFHYLDTQHSEVSSQQFTENGDFVRAYYEIGKNTFHYNDKLKGYEQITTNNELEKDVCDMVGNTYQRNLPFLRAVPLLRRYYKKNCHLIDKISQPKTEEEKLYRRNSLLMMLSREYCFRAELMLQSTLAEQVCNNNNSHSRWLRYTKRNLALLGR